MGVDRKTSIVSEKKGDGAWIFFKFVTNKHRVRILGYTNKKNHVQKLKKLVLILMNFKILKTNVSCSDNNLLKSFISSRGG